MDAAVRDELVEGQAGDLAADGLEGRDDDRLGCVVDDEIHARRGLEGADVAPLAADDAALQVVRGQLDDRDRRLDDRIRSETLDRHADQAPRLLCGLFRRLFLDAAHQAGRLDARFVFDRLHQIAPGVDRGEARDLLEALALLVDHLLDLRVRVGQDFLLVGDRLLLAVVVLLPFLELGELAVEVFFLLENSILEGCDLLPPCLDGLVELGPGRQDLLLGLDRSLSQLPFGGLLRLCQNALGLRPDRGPLPTDFLPQQEIGDGQQDGVGHQNHRGQRRERHVHLGPPARGCRRQTAVTRGAGSGASDEGEDLDTQCSEPKPLVILRVPDRIGVPTLGLQAPRASSSLRIRRSARARACAGSPSRRFSIW